MNKKSAALFLLVMLFVPPALADTVILEDGMRIEGTITEETGDYLMIDSEGDELLFDLKEIRSVERSGESAGGGETFREFGPRDAGIAIAIAGVLAIFFIAVYVYSSLCLMYIARKTNTEPAWMAWVPVANVFLVCRIAQVSYWWAGGALSIGLIPYVGLLATLGIGGFLWYKIAIARGKPGWLGALTVVPFVNFVTMGILAFSE